MTGGFTNIFGGSAISPADVAFAEYSFSSNLTLFWPQFSAGQTNVAARFMNLTASVSSLNVFMPDATLVSVGYDVVICNRGSNTFNVVDANGGAIASIDSGKVFYILLTDNTTSSGTWQVTQFGVGTGSAVASALAGNGLIAIAGLLNVNFDAATQTSDYTIAPGNRAVLQVWTGGAGTITLPTAASAGDGFFFPVANNGSGDLVIAASGSDMIDGNPTSTYSQSQSGFIISDGGTNWYSVGKGIQNNFAITLLNLNVAGNTDVTETSAQAQNIIQQLTGTLTGNINVIVPNTVQMYIVYNNTGGAFTLTVKTAAGSGFVIPQGQTVILYCDGTDVVSALTTTVQVIGQLSYSIGTAGGTANALTGSATGFVLQTGTVVWAQPSHINTGSATLNVQSTGAIVIKKVAPGGLVNLDAGDLEPTLVNVFYYNGSNWISVNTIYEGVYETLSTDTTLGFVQFLNSVNVTAPINLTLPSTALFPHYFTTTLFASGGAITLIPDAGDSIQGLSAGTNYVIPQSGSAKLATDAAGNWTLFTYNISIVADDTTTNATVYPTWAYGDSSGQTLQTSSTKFHLNPSTGILTAIGFAGNLTGNVTGNVTGNLTGNVTGNITGSAPAGSLTGTTLASNVVTSSLTTVGTIIAGVWNGTAITASNIATGTSGANIPLLNGNNTWSGTQSFNSSDFILKGSGSGTTVINASATASGTITVPAATDTLVGKATTDIFTNKTYDTAGTGNVLKVAGTQVTALSGNTGTLGTTTGSLTNNHIAIFDSSGNIKDGGAIPTSEVILIDTKTASNSATLDFTSDITSSYDYYYFILVDVLPATNTVLLNLQTSLNNGSTWDGSGYQWGVTSGISLGGAAAIAAVYSSSDSKIPLNAGTNTSGTTGVNGISGKVELFAPNSTAASKYIKSSIKYLASGGNLSTMNVDAVRNTASAVNAIRFAFSSGNITSGTIYLYGVKNT